MQASLRLRANRVLIVILGGASCLCLREPRGIAAEQQSKLPPAAARPVDFLRDVQPILTNSCFECHGLQKQKGGLRLDQKEVALKGGDSGAVLIAGKSAESLLIQA